MNKEIQILMSFRAYLLLKEEYPMSANYIRLRPVSSSYYIRANVQSFKAPGRFVMGIPDQVKVLGSDEFIEYLEEIGWKSRGNKI